MKVTLYAHGSKENVWEAGEKLGLTGDALSMFSHAIDEVKLTLTVHKNTGIATITHVDGRAVMPAKEKP